MKKNATALALFSGGLDSILSCRVVAAQGVRVIAVKFVTPFFDYDLLADEEAYRRRIRETCGIEVMVRDITDPYLAMLRNPSHGYGKHFNPCIDCKILMIRTAKEMLADFDASCIITGEVIGQRPMSQRKDTLRVIERDSGAESLLLRPLCARSQKPTAIELAGVIDRDRLPDFSGRGRSGQIALAERFGITSYPNPAGGCTLTDPNLAARVRRLYAESTEIDRHDLRFLLIGRQFRLPGGGWLVVGRQQEENDTVLGLRRPGDILLRLHDRPGPTGLLRHSRHDDDIRLAAALLVRYARKIAGRLEGEVRLDDGESARIINTAPLTDRLFAGLTVL